MVSHEMAVTCVRKLLEYIGEDTEREGLLETPERIIRAYDEIFLKGQRDKDEYDKLLKVFEDGSCDEMVVLADVPFVSFCEHHMLPFQGVGHIGYVPNGRVIGVSKLARILEYYSRRLQIQERLAQQVTVFLMDNLEPKGAACVLEATHACMQCRGVRKTGTMITSCLRGEMLRTEVRAEFLHFCYRGRR